MAVGVSERVRPAHTEPRIGHRTGRSGRPQARPPRPVRNPRLGADPVVPALGCELEQRWASERRDVETAAWRLTDRGIAVIIATGLAIAMAALMVVTLTAMRVTSDGYAPNGYSHSR